MMTSLSMAQTHEEGDHSHNPYADPTVGPLIQPAADDFIGDPGSIGAEKAAGDKGLATFFEVTSNQKTGLLTPFYRFSSALAFKVRVPLIIDKTQTSWDGERSTSGLGDIAIDAEYSRPAGPGAEWRLQGSVKLPTGDHEKMVDLDGVEQVVPLGTGSMDILARGQYAKSGVNLDWVASALYRKNDSSETVNDYGTYTATSKITNGDQVVFSGFARRRANDSWWLHLGASMVKFSDGTFDVEYSAVHDDTSSDLLQSGTLFDLYPGVSYALGKLNPYLGARIPIGTSYDDEFANTKRDTAFIFQFTYNPTKMGG